MRYILTYTLDGTYETTTAVVVRTDDNDGERDVLEHNLRLVLEREGLGQTDIEHIIEDKSYSICKLFSEYNLDQLLAEEYGEQE